MSRRKATAPAAEQIPASPADTTDAASAAGMLYGKYRELTRKHLDSLFDQLLAQFTGLHFHVAWVPPTWRHQPAWTLPMACSSCCRLARTNFEDRAVCRRCGPRQLVRVLRTGCEGLRFTCRLGVMNHWLPIRIRDVRFGIAYIQALNDAPRGQSAHRTVSRAASRPLSRSEFLLAGRLFVLIIQHVQSLDLAELQNEELGKVRQALGVLENVLARLRRKLNGVLPAFSKLPPVIQPESHAERTVHAVLERIQRGYAQPLTLQKLARDLRLNAAYLSHLFSHTVGLAFKTCLTEVRVQKAQELLSDPANNISDVAKAAGYASADRFRTAFKNVTGLSPRRWRETMRTKAPPG